MKKVLIVVIAISVSMSCFADSETEKRPTVIEIEGLYHVSGVPSEGLKIKKLSSGNYIFQAVDIISGKITKSEWQSAYVLKNETNKYMFYWHTGRFDDTMPESNTLIVYELEATGKGFEGIYFFPEETRNPPARITYKKIE